jgi:CheY-like chemotaxis protein
VRRAHDAGGAGGRRQRRQRAALRAVLEDLDVTIVEAESGRDALRCLLRQPFAVVLLDVNMPGLDGFETAD